ncbi:MAG: hypothetical protein FWH04_08190 [Oscillospiraceae bacterium]|nr:hypothetical protein [Oscillospiraceae bacterium]
MEISEIFDSMDRAERALIHLQEQGILPSVYKIKRRGTRAVLSVTVDDYSVTDARRTLSERG